MLAGFTTISANSADVMSQLGILSKNAYAFLKLGFPVGSLLANSLQISSKVGGGEAKYLL